jgi:hypothetical protein
MPEPQVPDPDLGGYDVPLRPMVDEPEPAPRRKPVLSFDLYPKRKEGEELHHILASTRAPERSIEDVLAEERPDRGAPPDRRPVDKLPGLLDAVPVNQSDLVSNAAETAALRTRESVRPTGGREEGAATDIIQQAPGAIISAPFRAIGHGADAMRRVFEGELDPMSPEGIGEGLQAGMQVLGQSPFMGRNTLGVGGGKLIQPAAREATEKATGGVGDMIRAYHGSPHDFERFDLSKIGTGEGAQAYGHGLYFAENEGVAKGYRDTLSQGLKGLQPLGSASPEVRARLNAIQDRYGAQDFDRAFKKIGATRDYHTNEAQSAFERYVDDPRRAEAEYNKNLAAATKAEDDLRFLDENQHNLEAHKGRMYEVGIKANPEHFLDWDKPLSEQHPTVQKAIEDNFLLPTKPTDTGQQLYDAFRSYGRGGGDESGSRLSERLREAGIPGIKYLDQGSRDPAKMKELAADLAQYREAAKHWEATGNKEKLAIANKQIDVLSKRLQETRNYVVFDDKLIDILKKYGIAGIGALPAMNAYHYQDGKQ